MNRTANVTPRNNRSKPGRSMIFLVTVSLFASLVWFTWNSINSPISVKIGSNQDSKIAPFFSRSVQYWNDDIQRWAKVYELDPNLIATVMQIESCGDPTVVSGAGAMGLFQVMPFHFDIYDDPFEPETNAARGLAYLSLSFEQSGGNAGIAMAGYNGGVGVIGLPSSQWFDETQRYYYWGDLIYQDAVNRVTHSAAVDDWMNTLGRGMCSNAEIQLGSLP